MIPGFVHRCAWGGTLVVGGAVALAAIAAEGTRPWEGWEASRDLQTPGYAERVHPERIIRTRANTCSNLAYVTVGLYACGLAIADRRRNRDVPALGQPDRDVPATLSFLFGVACIWLGFASGLFHASLTRAGQRLDVAAMYPPLLTLLAMAVARWLPPRLPGCRGLPPATMLATGVVVAAVALWKWKWSMSARNTLVPLILAVATGAALTHAWQPGRLRPRWLAAAAACLGLGIVCREADVAGRFPVSADSWFQGHALWHVFTAAALAAMYGHERSRGAVLAPPP